MLEAVISVILLPFALLAGLFTAAVCVGAIKAIFKRPKKKKTEVCENLN